MIITLSRSGGFTGIPLKKTIDTKKLPAEKAKKIEELVSAANFFNFETPNRHTDKGKPDQFNYTLSIQHDMLSRTLSINEENLNEPLRKLIGYLKFDI